MHSSVTPPGNEKSEKIQLGVSANRNEAENEDKIIYHFARCEAFRNYLRNLVCVLSNANRGVVQFSVSEAY